MKKLLFILLLFIALVSNAQMTRTVHIGENAFGHTVTYIHYAPKQPSNYYLIFYHGKGELGPIDGTQITEVEKNGPPRHAKNGYEYPFHIIAPQAATSYNYIRKFLPAYVKTKFNADVIIVTGLSMGGFATFDTPMYDDFKLVYAYMPVCGGINAFNAPNYPEVIMKAYHGSADGTVKYQQSLGFVTEYNKTHTQKIEYVLFEGMGYNIWDKVYNVIPGQDEATQWIIRKFNEAPKPTVPIDGEALKNRIIEAVRAVPVQ